MHVLVVASKALFLGFKPTLMLIAYGLNLASTCLKEPYVSAVAGLVGLVH